MRKVAIIGTMGVPAKYGGFETLVENMLGDNCSSGIQYTVYCSGKSYPVRLKEYKGATLRYIGLRSNGTQSIPYDIISILRAIPDSEVLLILGVSGCVILPFIRLVSKKRIIINIDGLEHRRDKWSPRVRRFLKWLEKLAVRYADVVVADNKAIQDYIKEEYGRDDVELITYGGDHVLCDVSSISVDVLSTYNLSPRSYSFSVCRIEPENNVHTTLEAFASSGKKLVFVGNWDRSDYGRKQKEKYGTYPNIQLLDPIYDLAALNVLRSNCLFYIHGHSAGGTNPSLVEAMFFGMPVLAFDCVYNRETTENKADYFTTPDHLARLVNEERAKFESNGVDMKEIAERRYRWFKIAKQYENLY